MSAQAKKRLVSALVSLAKSTRGGYDGLRASGISGGRKRRPRRRAGNLGVTNLMSGGALSGGALSGGRKRRPRRKAGNLGVTNLMSGGALSGGRRTRRGCGESGGAKRKRKPTGGQTKWIDFVKKVQAKYRLTYRDAMMKASDLKRQGHYR